MNKKDFDSFIKKCASKLERKYTCKRTANSSDKITHQKKTTQMRTRNMNAAHAESFEYELIDYIKTVNASECMMKGFLSDYVSSQVRNNWFQEDSYNQRSRVHNEQEQILQICKKYNLKCSFNKQSKSGKYMGFDCSIISTEYSVFLFDADIKRLKFLILNNHVTQKNSKTKEIQENLEKHSCGSNAIEKFKNSSLFSYISKEINENIYQKSVSVDGIRYLNISIAIYVNVIKIGLHCDNPAMILFEKHYFFEKLGCKNIENSNQENTIYCAFIEYYKKYLDIHPFSFDKLDYSTGLEEYGSGNPSVCIYFYIKTAQKQELKDLF